jgi:hypothetical protein
MFLHNVERRKFQESLEELKELALLPAFMVSPLLTNPEQINTYLYIEVLPAGSGLDLVTSASMRQSFSPANG